MLRRRIEVPEDLARLRLVEAARPLAAAEVVRTWLVPLVDDHWRTERVHQPRGGRCQWSEPHSKLVVIAREFPFWISEADAEWIQRQVCRRAGSLDSNLVRVDFDAGLGGCPLDARHRLGAILARLPAAEHAHPEHVVRERGDLDGSASDLQTNRGRRLPDHVGFAE